MLCLIIQHSHQVIDSMNSDLIRQMQQASLQLQKAAMHYSHTRNLMAKNMLYCKQEQDRRMTKKFSKKP